jgi:hypothetical protein
LIGCLKDGKGALNGGAAPGQVPKVAQHGAEVGEAAGGVEMLRTQSDLVRGLLVVTSCGGQVAELVRHASPGRQSPRASTTAYRGPLGCEAGVLAGHGSLIPRASHRDSAGGGQWTSRARTRSARCRSRAGSPTATSVLLSPGPAGESSLGIRLIVASALLLHPQAPQPDGSMVYQVLTGRQEREGWRLSVRD